MKRMRVAEWRVGVLVLWKVVMPWSRSEPRFEPEPLEPDLRFGSKFREFVEPNLRFGSRFRQKLDS